MWTRPRKIGVAAIVGVILISQIGPPVYDNFFGKVSWCDTNYRVDSPCTDEIPRWRARAMSEARYRDHRAEAARIPGGPEDFIVRLLTLPGDDRYGYGRQCIEIFGEPPSGTLLEKLRAAGVIHDPGLCDGDRAVIVQVDKISPMAPNIFDVILDMHCGWLCGSRAQWSVRRSPDGTLSVVERVHESIS
jgi:hypothetical protein